MSHRQPAARARLRLAGWQREPAELRLDRIQCASECDKDPVYKLIGEHSRDDADGCRRLAGEAGVADPQGLAHKWHILMRGSIVAAGEGDRGAAKRAQQVAALVLSDATSRSGQPVG